MGMLLAIGEFHPTYEGDLLYPPRAEGTLALRPVCRLNFGLSPKKGHNNTSRRGEGREQHNGKLA